MLTTEKAVSARIAELNDLCRQGSRSAGRIVKTQGVATLPIRDQLAIVGKVAVHNFTADEDPHGERDFGAFDHNGESIFWKIDYYDPSLEYGSDDPSDPAKTERVLTIMLASEY